jgi:hypothetical protein
VPRAYVEGPSRPDTFVPSPRPFRPPVDRPSLWPHLNQPEPAEPSQRTSAVERFVGDLARKGVEATVWHGITLAADAIAPGGGQLVNAFRITARLMGAAKSVATGNGLGLHLPVLVNRETGLSLNVIATVGGSHQTGRSAVGIEAGLDPFQPSHPGELMLEAAPARADAQPAWPHHGDGTMRGVRPITDRTGSVKGYTVVAPGPDISARANPTEVVDAVALRRYVEMEIGTADRPSKVNGPWPIVYLDPDAGLGLVAIVSGGSGQPYSPILLRVDPVRERRGDAPRLAAESRPEALVAPDPTVVLDPPVVPDLPAASDGAEVEEVRELPFVHRVNGSVRRDQTRPANAAEKRQTRRRPHRMETETHQSAAPAADWADNPAWTAAYRALRVRFPDHFAVDANIGDDQWPDAIEREHCDELRLIRRDIQVRLPDEIRDPQACVDAVTALSRSANLLSYWDGLVGFALIRLAGEAIDRGPASVSARSLINRLLQAAAIDVLI